MWRNAVVGVDPDHVEQLQLAWWDCTARGCSFKLCDAGHVLVLPHEVTWQPYLDTAKGMPSHLFKQHVAKGRTVTIGGGEVMVRKFAPVCREGECLQRVEAWDRVRYLWDSLDDSQRIEFVLAVRAGLIPELGMPAEEFWEVAALAMSDGDWAEVIEREKPWPVDWDE